MISNDKKFIFVHYPKTGGNSVQNILLSYADENVIVRRKKDNLLDEFELKHNNYKTKKHATLKEYYDVVPNKEFNKYFKFITIRNPWERIISFVFFHHNTFSKQKFYHLAQQFKPIEDYIFINGENSIDYLMKFENLQADFDIVCDKLSLPKQQLPHTNKSKHYHYSKYYDNAMYEFIAKKYKYDIKLGEYKFKISE